MDCNQLSVRMLDLLLLPHEGPEARFCHNGIRGKYAHSVHLGFGVLVCWLSSAHKQVLSDLLHRKLWFSLFSHKSYFLPLNNNNWIINAPYSITYRSHTPYSILHISICSIHYVVFTRTTLFDMKPCIESNVLCGGDYDFFGKS